MRSFIQTSLKRFSNYISVCVKTYLYIFAYICCEDFEINRSLFPFLLSRKDVSKPVLILSLSSCPLDLRAIFSQRLLTSLERNIYKIPRNPNAQFSASIFSGTQSTYIIFSPVTPWKYMEYSYMQLCTYIYVRACPSAIGQVEKREEGTNEWGKIVDSMGSMILVRRNVCPVSFFIWSILFVNWII